MPTLPPPPPFRTPDVAVIGAGVSGALLARRLVESGLDVTVYEKARGPGGRTSTRRGEVRGGPLYWDHGASGFELRDPEVLARAGAWEGAGVLERSGERYQARPGANALARHLLEGIPCRYGTAVGSLRPGGAGWELCGEDRNALGTAEVVLVTAPAPQAASLLESAGPSGAPLAERLRFVRYRPEVVALVALEAAWNEQAQELPLEGHPVLQTLRKHARDGLAAWTLHATERWARAHLEDDPARLAEDLVAAARESVNMPVPVQGSGHRWRYARVDVPLEEPFLLSLERHGGSLRGLGACGDAFGSARASDVEGALRSALHLARALGEEPARGG